MSGTPGSPSKSFYFLSQSGKRLSQRDRTRTSSGGNAVGLGISTGMPRPALSRSVSQHSGGGIASGSAITPTGNLTSMDAWDHGVELSSVEVKSSNGISSSSSSSSSNSSSSSSINSNSHSSGGYGAVPGSGAATAASAADPAAPRQVDASSSPTSWLWRWTTVLQEQMKSRVSDRQNSTVEPKIFLANERTFLAWLDMAVTLAAISVAVLAMSESNDYSVAYGLFILPISIGFCIYALMLYLQRNNMLRRKIPGPYYNNNGPVVMTCLLAGALSIYLAYSMYELYEYEEALVQAAQEAQQEQQLDMGMDIGVQPG